MYKINPQDNTTTLIDASTFSELGFKERQHLQEWIAKDPQILGEELLIIQKEFHDFDETQERLDLLAIDKMGNLVIIENKLDDSGHDVTWQILKYASYCSSLSSHQIEEIYQDYLKQNGIDKKSKDLLTDFLEVDDLNELRINQSQRMTMVAANFRKEVTSTVMWLIANYNLHIQCIKVTPYLHEHNTFLTVEQIIPVKEAEDYTIKMAQKAQEEIRDNNEKSKWKKLLQKFFGQLFKQIQKETNTLYSNVTPKPYGSHDCGAGMSGIVYNLTARKKKAEVGLYIVRDDKEENELIYDFFYQEKEKIEKITGPLIWEKHDDMKMCNIKIQKAGLDIQNEDEWDEVNAFMINYLLKFEEAFKDLIQECSKKNILSQKKK